MDPNDRMQLTVARKALREAHQILDALNKKHGNIKDILTSGYSLHLATTQALLAGINLDKVIQAEKPKG